MTIYEQVFHTAEYYCYEPVTELLEGWRLVGGRYQPLAANAQGWLWSEQLGLWVGPWTGTCFHYEARWLCFYDPAGQVVPLAEAAQQQAEAERRRAEAAEAELARLRATLGLGQGSDSGVST